MSRGYAFMVLAFVVCMYATFNIISKGNRNKDWMFFAISGALGCYAIPSFLYPFATLNVIILFYNYKNIDISKRKADYVLLPVWIVCYDYKKSEYIFAMNGQTGKIVGKPPLSKKKIFTWFSGISAGTYIALSIISLLLGGGS